MKLAEPIWTGIYLAPGFFFCAALLSAAATALLIIFGSTVDQCPSSHVSVTYGPQSQEGGGEPMDRKRKKGRQANYRKVPPAQPPKPFSESGSSPA